MRLDLTGLGGHGGPDRLAGDSWPQKTLGSLIGTDSVLGSCHVQKSLNPLGAFVVEIIAVFVIVLLAGSFFRPLLEVALQQKRSQLLILLLRSVRQSAQFCDLLVPPLSQRFSPFSLFLRNSTKDGKNK